MGSSGKPRISLDVRRVKASIEGELGMRVGPAAKSFSSVDVQADRREERAQMSLIERICPEIERGHEDSYTRQRGSKCRTKANPHLVCRFMHTQFSYFRFLNLFYAKISKWKINIKAIRISSY